MKWYIDSLDSLAGAAFASYRDEDARTHVWTSEAAFRTESRFGRLRDDSGDDAYATAAYTVYIRAPFFVPEPVASRAIALAARRGTFQSGFFIGGREQHFDDVAQIAEFTRRLFVGGGGGGAPGGPGTEVTPPPEPPVEPEAAEGHRDQEPSEVSTVMRSDFDRFQTTVEQNLKMEMTGTSFEWTASSAISRSPGVSKFGDPVQRGFSELVDELTRRRPKALTADTRWFRSFSALWALARRARVALSVPSSLWRLLENSPSPYMHHPYGPYPFIYDGYSTEDPFAAMQLVPIPAGLLDVSFARESTVADVVSSLMSSPQHANPWSAVFDVLLFAAVSLVSGSPQRVDHALWSPGNFDEPYGMVPPSPEMRDEQVSVALSWCERSLPKIAFTREIEDAIATVPTLAAA